MNDLTIIDKDITNLDPITLDPAVVELIVEPVVEDEDSE